MAGSWLRPGRFVQLPVGYVLLAGAAVLVLVVLGYMLGYSRGKDAARLVLEEDLEGPSLVGQDQHRPRDPLAGRTTGTGSVATQQGQSTGLSGSQAGSGARQWGPIDSDPRRAGLNYYRLAETRADGARRLAEFCREQGLETYVVSSNNPRLRRVIALPGFEPGQGTSPEARAVEALIHRIGREWKATEPGASDLRDAYLERYGS